MQVIKIRHPLTKDQVVDTPVVLAMGFFDGVHLAHQKVIKNAKKIATDRKMKLAVLTYDHHPGLVYQAMETPIKYLSPFPRKLELFEALGVDIVYAVSFTSKFAMQTPQQFVDRYLVGFHTKVAVAGWDHTYGPKDIATMNKLDSYSKGRFETVTIKELEEDGHKVSSSRIRNLFKDGTIQEINELLGYDYQTTGLVIHGEARGRELGYPTANIAGKQDEWLPKVGVYAVQMQVGGTWYDGMASIGYNITFGDKRPKTVEIYLFDYNDQIYGENVKVKWLAWMRDEIKYDGAKALIDQLEQDEINIKKLLAKKENH